MPERVVRVVVRGQVQGVGFRAWVHRQAAMRGLEGYVRNRRDGSVEAVFAGAGGIVDSMLAACRRGPASADVANVEVEEAGRDLVPAPGSGRFEVRETA